MLATITQHIKYGSTYNCIEHSEKEGQEVYRYLRTKLSKGELQIDEQDSFINSEKLIQEIPKDKSYHLVINNDEVLYTSIETKHTVSKNIVQEAYPNIRLEDFYYECILGQTAHVFICQKTYIDTFLKIYEKEKIYITELSLAFSPITSLRSFIKKDSSIHLSNYNVQWESDNLIITPSTEEPITSYDIDGVLLSSEDIITFSATLISYIGKANSIKHNFDKIRKVLQKTFLQHRFFKLALPIAVGILFLLGVLNTIVYTRYFGKVQELVQLTELNKAQRQALIIDDSLVSKKQKLFEDVIKSTSSKSSAYIDQISSLKPLSISLSSIRYQPLAKRLRNDKPILLETNRILIEGILTDTEELSSWIRLLERELFINEISIENLFREENETKFTLNILVNED